MKLNAEFMVYTEVASAHKMETAEVDMYDGQGRFATFLSNTDAQAFAQLLQIAEVFTQYVARPDDGPYELRRAHDDATLILERFARRMKANQ